MPSKKTRTLTKPKKSEVEKIVLEIAKEEKTPAKIGLILRDKHSIPKVKALGKKITQILKENNIQYPSEKEISEKKSEKIKIHLKQNKHDYTAQQSLTKQLWKIQKLNKK